MSYRERRKPVSINLGDREAAAMRCREIRRTEGLSQYIMALALNCRQTSISCLESGHPTAPTWLVRAVLELKGSPLDLLK